MSDKELDIIFEVTEGGEISGVEPGDEIKTTDEWYHVLVGFDELRTQIFGPKDKSERLAVHSESFRDTEL